MIYAVTGVGPRTGTSWVMERLEQAGLPIYYTKWLKLDGAGYETSRTEIEGLQNVIAKIWPNNLSKANVAKMLVLSRNKASQIPSIKKQMVRERKAGFVINQNPKQIIASAKWILDQSKIQRMDVRTEDLNKRIDEIIDWFSEPFEQVRTG